MRMPLRPNRTSRYFTAMRGKLHLQRGIFVGSFTLLSSIQAAESPYFIKTSISAELPGARVVTAADLDGDGQAELLVASRTPGALSLWSNPDGQGLGWVGTSIDAAVAGLASLEAVDLDNDGDLDVLGAVKDLNDILWWENLDGAATAWTRHALNTALPGAIVARAGDLDGDGDLDIIAGGFLSNTVAWFENTTPATAVEEVSTFSRTSSHTDNHTPARELSWTRHDIDLLFAGVYDLQFADVNGDGQPDVVGAARYHNALRWWQLTPETETGWTVHSIAEGFYYAESLVEADVDGDGDADFIGAAGRSEAVSWFENISGVGLEWTAHPIDKAFPDVSQVVSVDLDGDGDPDLVSAARNTGVVHYSENMDGLGLDWRTHALDTTLPGAAGLAIASIGGDESPDVVVAAEVASQLVWYENQLNLDLDGDGFSVAHGDCNDADPAISPAALELPDELDNDCDGLIDEGLATTDDDGDGFAEAAGDCNDADATISPAAAELCDDFDNNCDDVVDMDAINRVEYHPDVDQDSFGAADEGVLACTPPPGSVTDATDCNDASAAAYPGAPEVCDGLDNNCDGKTDENLLATFYPDVDDDGYGQTDAGQALCQAPAGYTLIPGDCQDEDPDIHPDQPELCDAKDNNCDGQLDEGLTRPYYPDQDGDGYAGPDNPIEVCVAPVGYQWVVSDCNDQNAAIHPGAEEICNDGIDNDCAGGSLICPDESPKPEVDGAGGCSCASAERGGQSSGPGWPGPGAAMMLGVAVFGSVRRRDLVSKGLNSCVEAQDFVQSHETK